MSPKALKASRALWRRRLLYRQRKVDYYRGQAKSGEGSATKGVVTADEARLIAKWERLRNEARATVERRDEQIAQLEPLRLRALRHAEALIGVMEKGGNNRGEMVTKIIRANGGAGPEPWCGDFVAYAYRAAGSKAVGRGWASVALLGGLAGLKTVNSPRAGDIVRFKFSHTGLFEKDLGGGFIQTIEGNTGASGAVSDSQHGGDGVYRKRRAKSLVDNYRRVLR